MSVLLLLFSFATIFTAKLTLGQSLNESLAYKKNCIACHQLDSQRIGPPLQAIAERYRSLQNAENYLAHIIQKGGRGSWGVVPMPAQPHVTKQEAFELARWILSLPPLVH